MKQYIIAKRYGEAFVSYVKETIGIERALNEIKALRKIILDNPELEKYFLGPELTNVEKYNLVDTVLKKYFSYELVQFLKFLIEKRRISLILEIIYYVGFKYAYDEAVKVLVRSAYKLDEDVVNEIQQKLENKLEKKVFCHPKVDKSLIGGLDLMIMSDNTIIDGSIRKRFNDLGVKLITKGVV